MASKIQPERSIREVMSKGSWVRQTLEAHGEIDPTTWAGRPGTEVAADLLTQVMAIDMSSDPEAAAKRADIMDRCGKFLGTTAIPAHQPIDVA